MARLIIFEGSDGLGKSTQATLLATVMKARLIQQPSEFNTVGFLRTECKFNSDYSPYERQLLHTASHLVDAYEALDGSDTVMDRSFLSGQVYGSLMGLTNRQLYLLHRINSDVYRHQVQKFGYSVDIMFLDADFSFKASQDNDVYERQTKRDELRRGYARIFAGDRVPAFADDETVHRVVLNKETHIWDVHQEIRRLLHV